MSLLMTCCVGRCAGFLLFNVLFTLARLSTIVVSVLTFWFGLARSENPGLDLATGNFNTYLVR